MGNFIDLSYTKSLIDGAVLQTCLIGTKASLEMQILRPHSRPSKSESRGVQSSDQWFNKLLAGYDAG